MRAALLGNHPFKPSVHLVSADELALLAAGHELTKRLDLQRLGIHSLAQQVDPVCRTELKLE